MSTFLVPLAQEARQMPTFEGFELQFRLGFIGRYWRFVREEDTQKVFYMPRHTLKLITPDPTLGLEAYRHYRFLAEIVLTAAIIGKHYRVASPGWIEVIDQQHAEIIRVSAIARGIVRANQYWSQIPHSPEELLRFYQAAHEGKIDGTSDVP